MKIIMAVCCLLFCVAFSNEVVAQRCQPIGKCKVTAVKVLSPQILYVESSNKWPEVDLIADIWIANDGWQKHPDTIPQFQRVESASRVSIKRTKENGSILEDARFLILEFPGQLSPARDYHLVIRQQTAGQPTDEQILALDFSTKAKVNIERFPENATLGSKLRIRSSTAIEPAVPTSNCNTPPCNLIEVKEKALIDPNTGSKTTEKVSTHTVKTQILEPVLDPRNPKPPNNPNNINDPTRPADDFDVDRLGIVVITLTDDKLRQAKPTVRLDGLRDVFGQPLQTETAVQIGDPPKGKDDSVEYLNISHQGGTGSKPTVDLDLKLSPILKRFGPNYYFQPSILVSIAHNDSKSPNTINLGVTFTRGTTLRGDSFFEAWRASITGSYETDRSFVKSNLLATPEMQFWLKHFYNSAAIRTQQRFHDFSRAHPDAKIDDIQPAKFGYGIELFAGIETGGSLREQIFQNVKKTASIPIDRYGILRLRPRIHSFLEYDRLTLDNTFVPRFLITHELIGEVLPSGLLNIRKESGFRSYNETSLKFALDSGKHINLSITYKIGVAPPTYNRVNTVTSGIVFMY